MATYEFKVYNWTGNGGYNTQYNTSHTATVTDNDARYEGLEDMDEVVCIDGAECSTGEGEPYSINISFTDTDGNDHVELFHFMNVDNQWYFAPGTDSAFTEGAILGDYQSHTTGWNYGQVTCFVAGTMIATPEGEVPVETLSAGDFVSDDTGQALEVAQVMRRQIGPLELARGPGLRPICISQGALGKGLPETDLSVSRQHRILLRAPGANGIAGQAECLVAACRLLALPGVDVDPAEDGVDYCHIVVHRHAILRANGAPAESFYPGQQALRSMPAAAREELHAIFGQAEIEAATVPFAKTCPDRRVQKQLVAELASAMP